MADTFGTAGQHSPPLFQATLQWISHPIASHVYNQTTFLQLNIAQSQLHSFNKTDWKLILMFLLLSMTGAHFCGGV